jgi:hypothetical protein
MEELPRDAPAQNTRKAAPPAISSLTLLPIILRVYRTGYLP